MITSIAALAWSRRDEAAAAWRPRCPGSIFEMEGTPFFNSAPALRMEGRRDDQLAGEIRLDLRANYGSLFSASLTGSFPIARTPEERLRGRNLVPEIAMYPARGAEVARVCAARK